MSRADVAAAAPARHTANQQPCLGLSALFRLKRERMRIPLPLPSVMAPAHTTHHQHNIQVAAGSQGRT